MPKISKVLIVGYRDSSMEPAYEIVSLLGDFGYSTDMCHCNSDESPSKIKASQSLDGDTSLSGYDGVVFLDDGGDSEAAIKVAKMASKDGIVIGGAGPGVGILHEAGLLKDKYVCSGLDDSSGIYEKSTMVDAPSVRDDDVVTSNGACGNGFAVLLVDALGGKIRNVVRSNGVLPSRSALVIAPIASWSSYWKVAKRMRDMGSYLAIADWGDVNVPDNRIDVCALLDTEGGDISVLARQPIPRSVCLRDPSMSHAQAVAAIESLEGIGCVSVNPSGVFRACMSDSVVDLLAAAARYDGNAFDDESMDDAMDLLMSSGVKMVGAGPSSNESKALKVSGMNDTAIVTKIGASRGNSLILNRSSLRNMMERTFGAGGFVISTATNLLRIGKDRFELRWTMRRGPDGWLATRRIAAAGDMRLEAGDVLRVVLPEEWEHLMADADSMSQIVSMIIQSILGDDVDMSELGVTMIVDEDGPIAKSVTPAPEIVDESRTCASRRRLASAMAGLGMTAASQASTGSENGDVDGLATLLAARTTDGMHGRVLERELANEGMWVQPDGSVAMMSHGGMRRVGGLDELVERLRGDAISAIENEIRTSRGMGAGETEKEMAGLVSRAARHRLLVAREMLAEHGRNTRTAGIYPSSVAGPFSHLELPIHERVLEWHEGDDWLEDRDKAISDLPRYNPEYDKANPTESEGFYYTWDEQRRTPTDWLDSLKGDTAYPTRNLLSPGKMY